MWLAVVWLAEKDEDEEKGLGTVVTDTLFGVTMSSLAPMATEWLISASAIVPLSPKLDTTSDSRQQSAHDKHGHQVDHSTRRVIVLQSLKLSGKWSKILLLGPYLELLAAFAVIVLDGA